jgi:uncharacterized protein (DUF2267 family)
MQTKHEFLSQVQRGSGLAELEQAERLTERVFKTLRGRISADEAAHVEAHLPEGLRTLWRGGVVRAFASALTGTSTLSYDDFVVKLGEDFGVKHDQAEAMTRAVFRVLKDAIGEGESADLAAQLPKALKIAWIDA